MRGGDKETSAKLLRNSNILYHKSTTPETDNDIQTLNIQVINHFAILIFKKGLREIIWTV